MIELKNALEAIRLSESKAREYGFKVTIAIVDEHGELVALNRMDGALPISTKFALSKARTSALIGLPTEVIAQYAIEGKPYFGINTAFGGEMITIKGGLPVKSKDVIVGGIGVGGSLDVNDDAKCAEEALKAFGQ